MPERHLEDADRPPSAASHHYQHAADHLRRGAAYLDKATKRVERYEHASAAELAKAAAGHVGQATTHLGEAQRLHAEREARTAGSHWNEPLDEQDIDQS